MSKRSLPFILLWTLLWAIFFGDLLLGQSSLPHSDLSGQFHTFGLFQAQEMLAGRLPLWSPGSYAGFPFAADPQAAVFYPIRWLTILFSAPVGFSYYVLTLEGLFHIWLAGLFTYLLATDQTGNRWAGLLAALSFGLGGYLIAYPLLQLALLETIIWLPLILWLLRRGIEAAAVENEGTADWQQRPLPYLLGAGLVWGLSYTAGHPQTFLHLSYLTAAYYLFLTLRAGWSWRWVGGMGLLLAGTAVGSAAAAWLPTLRYLRHTTRSDVAYEFVAAGFPLLDYLQLLVPGALTVWSPMYMGLAMLLLLLVAWLARSQAGAGQRAEIGFWTAVFLLTFILSLGDKGVLFELVYHLAPGFDLFRQQERLVGLLSLSLALLAAQGFTLWWSAAVSLRQKWLRSVTAVMLAAFLLVGLTLAAVNPDNWLRLWLQQGGLLLLLLLILWRLGPSRQLAWGLLLLLSVDLFLAGRGVLNLQPAPPHSVWAQPEWLSLLPADEPARFDSSLLFHANVGELLGVEDIRGLSPLKLQTMSRMEVLPNGRRWQLLNVSHVLARQMPIEAMVTELAPAETHIMAGQPLQATLYRFEEALPRAWLVYQPHFAPDEEAAYRQIADPNFDPAAEVILSGELDVGLWTAVSPPTKAPQTNTRRLAANALHIEAQTDTPGILVISEWDYPGWQVRLNGQPAVTARANTAFQAILLPAGSHSISLHFAPWDVTLGIALSMLTLLAAGGVVWRWQPVITRRETAVDLSGWRPVMPHWRQGWAHPLSNRAALWGGTAVILLGFVLRLFRLGHQELRGDEAFSYLFASLPAAEITPALLLEGDPHSPLHYLLLHGWLMLAGDSEFALRYLSLIFGLLSLPLLYLLAATLFNKRNGLLSLLLVTVSQSLIWLAQDVRNQYMMVLCFGLLATVLLTRYLVPLANGDQAAPLSRRQLLLWLAYALAAAAAVYSHYYGLFILLSHGFYLWWATDGWATDGWATNRWLPWGSWALSGLLAALLFAPWLLATWFHLLAAGQFSDPAYPELATYLVNAGTELSVGSALTGRGVRWLFAALLLLALWGGWFLRRHRTAWAALLLGWWGSATLFIFLILFSRSTFNPFYISVAAPAWWLLVTAGLMALWQQPGRHWRAVAVTGLGFILVTNGLSLQNYYFDPAHSRTIGYRQLATQIEAEMEANDLFLAHFPDPALTYYLRRLALPLKMLPATWGETAAETEASLTQLTTEYERIWFVPYLHSVWDPANVVGRWLDYHMLHEQQSEAGHMKLWAFRPPAAVEPVMTPQTVRFGPHIRLHGIYITADGRPVDPAQPIILGGRTADAGPSGRPGVDSAEMTLTVTLLWEALAAIPDNYTVFVHLLDETGWLVAQHDGAPLFGTRPTTGWQPGELLLDRHEIVLPGDGGLGTGNGRLVVGLYHSETATRLPPDQNGDALTIGQWRR